MKQRSNSILDRPTEPAPRPVRRRVGWAILMLILAITGWAVTRHLMTGGLKSSEIAQAVVWIERGVKEDQPGHFRTARDHLLDAASVSVVDTYPAFLIHVVERLERSAGEELAVGADAPADERMIAAIRRRDWDGARAIAGETGAEGEKPRVYWERLVDDLARQSSTSAE